MPDAQDPRGRTNTVAMLGQAYSLLGFRIVDGVVGAMACGLMFARRFSMVARPASSGDITSSDEC